MEPQQKVDVCQRKWTNYMFEIVAVSRKRLEKGTNFGFVHPTAKLNINENENTSKMSPPFYFAPQGGRQ